MELSDNTSSDKLKLCPCSSQLSYSDCCQRYHKGRIPENALTLMRTRYSAYALGLSDYVITTTHPRNPARKTNLPLWRKELLAFTRGTKFKGLSILEFTDGESEAFVSFTAYLEQLGKDASFSERSRFLKEKGRWLYESGEIQKFLV